jgi:hypothetical protein
MTIPTIFAGLVGVDRAEHADPAPLHPRPGQISDQSFYPSP